MDSVNAVKNRIANKVQGAIQTRTSTRIMGEQLTVFPVREDEVTVHFMGHSLGRFQVRDSGMINRVSRLVFAEIRDKAKAQNLGPDEILARL